MSAEHPPWLDPLWDQLLHYQSQRRLPSALLISASTDLGQRGLVDRFAQSIFCVTPDASHTACGTCFACKLFEAGNYPDYLVLAPEPDSQVIKVDAVRKWCAALAYNPQYEQHRIAIIDQAHLMNHAAANSLLKTLEEPSRDTTLILLSDRASALPATIRSRCQQITLSGGDFQVREQWLSDQGCPSAAEYLHLAQGSPVHAHELWQAKALDLHDKLLQDFTALVMGRADPLAVSEQFRAHFPQPVMRFMSGWIMDLIRLKSGLADDSMGCLSKLSDLKMIQSQLDFQQLFDLLQRIYQHHAQQQNQLNEQLVIEDLLLHCGPYGLPNDQLQRI